MTKQNRKDSENENSDYSVDFSFMYKVNLELAGILFINALTQINEGKEKYNELESELEKYEESFKSRLESYEFDTEEFETYMLPKLRNLEVYYEPVVGCFSTAKILLVCCAETYINEVLNTIYTGKKLQELDKLSIVGKWIFIQDLLGLKKKMAIGRNPLQGFSSLVKERNKLVHFKGSRKSIQSLKIPNYIEELKLTPKDCLNNIKIVRDLIKEFSLNWAGTYGPDWLNAIEKAEYRNPCFYINDRENALVLYSKELDKDRFR